MDTNLQDLPEAQRIDYAPAPPPSRKRFPWLAIISAPVLGIAAFCLCLGLVLGNGRMTDRAMFLACGTGFGVCGGIWFWIALWRR